MIAILDKRAWILNRMEELSQNLFSYSWKLLGPHMQIMLCMRAEMDYEESR